MNNAAPRSKYAAVLFDVSIDKPLDYEIPEHLIAKIQRGMRITAPLRGKDHSGYVLEIKGSPNFTPVKLLSGISSEKQILTDDLFGLAVWMSKYYCTSLRQVLKIIIPASIRTPIKPKEQLFVMRGKTKEELQEICREIRNKNSAQADVLDVMLNVKKGILLTELLERAKTSRSPVDSLIKKGYLSIDIVRIDRSPLTNEQYFKTKAKSLNTPQREALEKISESIRQSRFQTHLIHGVTGSGKTEIYLQAIDQALQQGKGAIMLVPEISLTPQTIERFRTRFENKIAVLHHRLSHGERNDEWNRIAQGEAKIVIGARSAVFSPVQNLGMIIVDEEHENSYKQSDEMPCYNARDVAVMRGKLSNAVIVLGSATPSLESYYNATKQKYVLSQLSIRADTAQMPSVVIVDMKKEYEKAKGYTNFSEALLEGIKKRHAIGEQTILFLNRRGYHTTLNCQDCGSSVKCRHCDVSLTFHLGENNLSCHLCGFTIAPPPKQCPACRSLKQLKFKGTGTEQIERALHAIFPDIRTIRIDADTTRHKGSHQKLFKAFGTGKADVLIGTQMVAKGLHFPQVTLVGVLNSDASLHIPDYRASETVFQLITQVAGRAGRGNVHGEVIIQTLMPDNTTILNAAKQDFEAFYAEEIVSRQLFQYPPYCQMVKISLAGKNETKTRDLAEQLRGAMIHQLSENYKIHPVIPAGHAKVKDHYRFQFLIQGPSILPINQALASIQKQITIPAAIKFKIDVNPSSTFF